MKRLIPCVLALFMVMAFAVASPAADAKPFYVHLVVVPAALENGLSSQPVLPKFKEQVIQLAGGFTEIGATRGGSMGNGGVKDQENFSFIIGADTDISIKLKKMTKALFGGDGAFILAWPGTVMF